MLTVKGGVFLDYKRKVKELCEVLDLKNKPIGIHVYEKKEDLPNDCYLPYQKDGVRYAMCQLISMVKDENKKVGMTKKDHWCWKPLIGLGLVDIEKGSRAYEMAIKNNGVKDMEASSKNFDEFPKLHRNNDRSIMMCPLDVCDEKPDVILIYCDNIAQLRWLIGALKYRSGKRVVTELDYIDSCMWSLLPTLLTKEVRVTLPDPGETARGTCGDNEIILSLPEELFEQLVEDTVMKVTTQNQRLKNPDGTVKMNAKMVPDFPRPNFYNKLFECWGLDSNGVAAWVDEERE